MNLAEIKCVFSGESSLNYLGKCCYSCKIVNGKSFFAISVVRSLKIVQSCKHKIEVLGQKTSKAFNHDLQ